MKFECQGCGKSSDDAERAVMRLGLVVATKDSSETSDETYCAKCSLRIEQLDRNELHDRLQEMVKDRIIHPSKTMVSISESLVREIAYNLGASYRLTDALVERIFGANWTGAPPEDSGLVMNRFSNRDRLVVFVAGKLKDLWHLEP